MKLLLYKKKGECRSKSQEIPEISANLRRAFEELQDRPVLFKCCLVECLFISLDQDAPTKVFTVGHHHRYALDEYAAARRTATVKLFIDALTLGSETNRSLRSPSMGHSKPIELRSHDPIRYTSDMLAWMHQLTASEKEYVDSLTRTCRDGGIIEFLHACLDGITEGLCSPFQMRMEQLMVSIQDAVLLYRINNVLRFYEHTLRGLVGPTARLSAVLSEVQELSWRLLFNSLNQYSRKALEQPDYPSMELSPGDAVQDTLQLLLEILKAHDISLLSQSVRKTSNDEIIRTLLTPLIAHCQQSANRLLHSTTALTETDLLTHTSSAVENDDAPAESIIDRSKSATYLANCLYLIENTMARSGYSPTDNQTPHVVQSAELLNHSVETLVAAQASGILRGTRLAALVNALTQDGHDAERDGPLSQKEGAGLSEVEVRNAMAHFDVYLSNPDRFCIAELRLLNAPRLRKVVRRRAADAVHSHYQLIYQALVDPTNGYSSFCERNSETTSSSQHTQLRTPQQVADLILNF